VTLRYKEPETILTDPLTSSNAFEGVSRSVMGRLHGAPLPSAARRTTPKRATSAMTVSP